MRWIAIFLILIALAIPVLAQQFRQTPGGTVVYKMADAARISVAGNDTSKTGAFVAGCDLWGAHIWYDRIAGTTNVKLYIDISADGTRWVNWQSAAFDSQTTGTADVERIISISNPPNHAAYARLRSDGQGASGDTTDMTVWWMMTWLPQALNP